MLTLNLAGNIGIEHLKTAISSIFSNMRLDRDGDGKISRSELINALLGLLPTFFDYEDISEEVRDLDQTEIKELIDYVGKNFPDYAGVPDEVEAIIRQMIKMIGEVYMTVLVIRKAQRANTPEGAKEKANETMDDPSSEDASIPPPFKPLITKSKKATKG